MRIAELVLKLKQNNEVEMDIFKGLNDKEKKALFIDIFVVTPVITVIFGLIGYFIFILLPLFGLSELNAKYIGFSFFVSGVALEILKPSVWSNKDDGTGLRDRFKH